MTRTEVRRLTKARQRLMARFSRPLYYDAVCGLSAEEALLLAKPGAIQALHDSEPSVTPLWHPLMARIA